MKKLIRPMKAFFNFITSFSGWLRFQIALLISFLIGYHFYLRKYLSVNFNKYDEPYDYSYYNSVFNNMENSCLVVVFIMILLLVNHKRISSLFHKYNWHDRYIWIVIFCSACTQLAIVLFIKTVPISDSNYYIKQGELLYTTGKYISPLGFKTAFWPVGLPGYLSFLHMITDDYLFFAKCINILWSCAYIYLSYNLLKEYLTEKQKVIFVFLIAFLPNNIFSVNVIMTEIYFVVLFLLVLN
ncbi:MAG: hypothetical protein C0412_18110, partial [Flavobacterium sp.]|nr:hypothetical protein [Flavobacterium sp.]